MRRRRSVRRIVAECEGRLSARRLRRRVALGRGGVWRTCRRFHLGRECGPLAVDRSELLSRNSGAHAKSMTSRVIEPPYGVVRLANVDFPVPRCSAADQQRRIAICNAWRVGLAGRIGIMEIGVLGMRSSVRLMGASFAAAGLMAVGSPAFAGESEDNDPSVTTAAAEGGNGGHGGAGGFGVNICPAIGLLAPAEAECGAGNGGSANGGDAEATAEDDSKDHEKESDS